MSTTWSLITWSVTTALSATPALGLLNLNLLKFLGYHNGS
jgi:hypothetical protein